jgi:hypothetical protein
MEHSGAGQDAQPRALYREDAIRRILQAVDEVGGHLTSVDVQNAAFKAILVSDTFWHAKRSGTFVKYDLQKMRELAARVTRDGKVTPTAGEDRVDLLFRVQSHGLPADLLLKWQYERKEPPFEKERSRIPQDFSDPELLGRQNQELVLESAFSPTLIDKAAVASERRPRMKSTEPDTPVSARSAKSRRLKRKAITSIEESSPSEALSISTVRQKSPVVCPTPRDPEKARATQMYNDQNAMPLASEPRHLTPKDVIQQLQCIRDLQIDQVLRMIDYFKLPRSPSPVTVTPEPNQLLAALYRRCWGNEWRQDSDMLLRQDKRSVFNDTIALISSFLFDNVFTPTAEISQGHPDLSAQLLAMRVELLHTKLIAALGPFFSALVLLTREMYSTPSAGALLDPAFQQFETALAEIVTKAVALKSGLDGSDLRPKFVWPQNGELYDGERMQTAHHVDPGLADKYTVAYTTFPGVLIPRFGDFMGFTAFRAFVVLQVVARR